MHFSIGRWPTASARLSPQELVERAEAYVKTHANSPITIARLSRVVGRSERGLRSAFHGIHGVGPKRWMLTERLRAARQALCEARSESTTVTRIAADCGFSDFGRFARTYKRTFGETPSQTLRRRGGHDVRGK